MNGNRHPVALDKARAKPRIVRGQNRTGASSRRKGYRFGRRHTPHYYLVVGSLFGASVVAGIDVIAYLNRSVVWAEAAFTAVLVTSLVVFVTFFLGVSMALTGRVPIDRLKYVAVHGAIGTLAPLVYTLNICFALDGVGHDPLTLGSVVCGVLCLVLLLGQFGMGKTVVYRTPLRLVRGR